MQTAEELERMVDDADTHELAVALIEARDNAVQVALLDSLLTHAMPAYGIPVVSADVIRSYLERYTAKVTR